MRRSHAGRAVPRSDFSEVYGASFRPAYRAEGIGASPRRDAVAPFGHTRWRWYDRCNKTAAVGGYSAAEKVWRLNRALLRWGSDGNQFQRNDSQDEDGMPTIRQMLNKVPEVTLYFWLIKVLCTTVGETAADYLNGVLHFGLTGTSLVMGALLIVVLVFQFRERKYVPSIYWLAVVLISVVGTLITDNLTDNLGVSLKTTTIAFAIALAVTFAVWYASERTLSIHSIFTSRREAFYWLAILFTFALGTAAGDLTAETFKLGYLTSLLIFAAAIAVVAIVYFVTIGGGLSLEQSRRSTSAVVAFWLAYILTRPLGASIGDYLSQAPANGGLGLGTTVTSGLFLAAILALVVYLTATKADEIPAVAAE